MKAPAFAYVKPRSLAETFDLLERHGEGARLLAGGQSLMAALNMRLDEPRVLIDIGALDELSGIRVGRDGITIGALTRHRAVERSPDVARHLPLLRQAMPFVAHASIRNRGTFGGSIAFADPAAELPACCLALDATFVIRSRSGERRVAARAFFKGLYETDLRPGEVLVGCEFAQLGVDYRHSFQELARRHGDYAIVGVAACARLTGGVLNDVRLAFCGMGPTPLLAIAAAAAMDASPCSRDAVARAQALLERDLAPFDDPGQTAATKMHLARVLLGRALAQMTSQP
jgi:aerobic carbon-monoxide dehydrogenase medium subunit